MPSKNSRRSRSDRQGPSLKIICESPANAECAKDAAALLKALAPRLKTSVKKALASGNPIEEDDTAGEFVALRLVDADKRDARAIDSFALRDFEKRVLKGESRARGVPYEGAGLMKMYQKIIGAPPLSGGDTTVVLTDRLAMTWSYDDLRYHARVAVFGFPSVISMSGLVEAPARPREYYLVKQVIDSKGMGAADKALAQQFAGRYIEADDERTAKVLRGYLLQCVFYSNTLDPFCSDEDCVLFNAHWQEEMIRAQVSSGKLCKKHQEQLKHFESDALPNRG